MAVDATIEAIFGPAPEGLDLTESSTLAYDIACVIFMVFAVASVVLRFHTRLQVSGLGLDDYTIVVGLIFSGALLGTNIYAGQHAAGKHIWATTLPEFVLLLKVVYVEPYIYAVAVSSTKISVLLLYRRLFHAGDASMHRVYWAFFWFATFLAVVYPFIMFVVMALACRPVSFFWTQYEGATDGTCIDYLKFYVIYGGVNLLNDAIVLLVPIPRIIALHLSWRKKISVTGIMMLGSFVCVASIFRVYFLNELVHSHDASWWMGPGMAWSSLEPSAAIISACLPTFASLLRTTASRRRDKSSGASSGSGAYGGNVQRSGNYVRAWHTPAAASLAAPAAAAAVQAGAAKLDDDDEVELAPQKASSEGAKSRITVDTEIRVSQEERCRVVR